MQETAIVDFHVLQCHVHDLWTYRLTHVLLRNLLYYHENFPHVSMIIQAVSVFVSYLPFFNSILRQANTPFSKNQQYPTPFYLSAVYYHEYPRLLPDSILLRDSTIFPPIAMLSATSKNTQKWGPPPTVMNPTKPQNLLILSHSSILLPASTQIPMASIGNSRLCRCYTLMTFTPLYPIYPTQFDIRQIALSPLKSILFSATQSH